MKEERGGGDPIVYAVVCVALATVRMSDFFAACLCLCCKFIASEMFCLKFLQNLFGLPALPCLVLPRALVHSSCLATRVLVIVLATSWPKK